MSAATTLETEAAEILVGTYEDYVAGYQCASQTASIKSKSTTNQTNGITHILEQSFAVRCHSGSVRCLATNSDGSLAVSSGYDEVVNVFHLKRRKLLHTIELAIDCAVFVESNYLICGAQDGNIYIYHCKPSLMTLVKTLGGHKSAVTSLSVHPSEKALLSISKDNTMRTWNLIKGRSAYVTNIKSQTHLVSWTRGGNSFLLAANNDIYLYNNKSGSLEHNFKLDKRVNSIADIDDSHCIVASDSKSLEVLDLNEGLSVNKFEAHETRVKFVCLVSQNSDSVKFASASSDGILKLWSIDLADIASKPLELKQVDIGARITSMTTTQPNPNISKDDATDDDDDEDEEGPEDSDLSGDESSD